MSLPAHGPPRIAAAAAKAYENCREAVPAPALLFRSAASHHIGPCLPDEGMHLSNCCNVIPMVGEETGVRS